MRPTPTRAQTPVGALLPAAAAGASVRETTQDTFSASNPMQ